MTKAEFDQAMSKLTKVRSEIEAAHIDVTGALKSLHEIEAEILDAQPDNSPWKLHLAKIEQAKSESHTAIHRVLGLSEHADSTDSTQGMIETVKLTTSQRQLLDADPDYQAAEQKLASEADQVKLIRKTLFENDADWVKANEDLDHAKQHSNSQDSELRTAAVTAGSERNELVGEQRVKATARAIISQGEARLRQLGVKTNSKSVTSKSLKFSR